MDGSDTSIISAEVNFILHRDDNLVEVRTEDASSEDEPFTLADVMAKTS